MLLGSVSAAQKRECGLYAELDIALSGGGNGNADTSKCFEARKVELSDGHIDDAGDPVAGFYVVSVDDGETKKECKQLWDAGLRAGMIIVHPKGLDLEKDLKATKSLRVAPMKRERERADKEAMVQRFQRWYKKTDRHDALATLLSSSLEDGMGAFNRKQGERDLALEEQMLAVELAAADDRYRAEEEIEEKVEAMIRREEDLLIARHMKERNSFLKTSLEGVARVNRVTKEGNPAAHSAVFGTSKTVSFDEPHSVEITKEANANVPVALRWQGEHEMLDDLAYDGNGRLHPRPRNISRKKHELTAASPRRGLGSDILSSITGVVVGESEDPFADSNFKEDGAEDDDDDSEFESYSGSGISNLDVYDALDDADYADYGEELAAAGGGGGQELNTEIVGGWQVFKDAELGSQEVSRFGSSARFLDLKRGVHMGWNRPSEAGAAVGGGDEGGRGRARAIGGRSWKRRRRPAPQKRRKLLARRTRTPRTRTRRRRLNPMPLPRSPRRTRKRRRRPPRRRRRTRRTRRKVRKLREVQALLPQRTRSRARAVVKKKGRWRLGQKTAAGPV